MKYYIVFILSLFAISNLVADEHYISLEKFKLNLDSLEFYVEDIIVPDGEGGMREVKYARLKPRSSTKMTDTYKNAMDG